MAVTRVLKECRITRFREDEGEVLIIGPHKFKVEADKPYALKKLDPTTLRFEVHKGDLVHASDIKNGRDRSEVAMMQSYGREKVCTVDYDLYVELGPRSTPAWCALGQWHATDKATPGIPEGAGRPPPAAFHMTTGDMPLFEICYGEYGNVTREVKWRGSRMQRGKWYSIRIKTLFRRKAGNGFCRVWIDDERVVNYDGPMGFDDSNYWKHGIYRGTADEALAVRIKDFRIHVAK